jgi:hypothetical protein
MYQINVGNKWVGGHQPLLDFHTGIIAKVWMIGEKDGVIIFHDLDTLEEKGSVSFKIPINQRNFKDFSLLETIPPRKKLFLVGPVKVKRDFGKELFTIFTTLASGEISKHHLEDVKERILKFQNTFGGREFRTIAHLNRDILWFILPRLGVWVAPSLMLSELLETEEGQSSLEETIKLMRELSPKNPPFWGWNKEKFERYPITNWDEVEKLLSKKKLIPKKLALSCFLRCLKVKGIIRGPGQARYEAGFLENFRNLTFPLPPAITLTSYQGVPPIWREKVPNDFRPSALLLWLMGGQFDPKDIQYIKCEN